MTMMMIIIIIIRMLIVMILMTMKDVDSYRYYDADDDEC
jgi:ABC-type cobalt transport system substrate-binding protein